MMSKWLCRLVSGLLLLATLPSFAHEVRPAYLQLTDNSTESAARYDILWKQPIVENRRLPIDPIFPEPCELRETAQAEVTSNALIYRWTTACDLSDASIHINGLSRTLTDVMVRSTNRDGEVSTYLLRPESPTLDLSDQAAPVFAYLRMGIEHLLFGIDHVLFVIGLVLFIRDPWMLLKTVTAFTIAHSVTLGLSVLNIIKLNQGPVEAVIALSILFLARELVLPEERRSQITLGRPWVMAMLFGLLHGLGFAGALRDIGLPDDALWLSLLLFNIGIEIGQLIVIAILLAIAAVTARHLATDKLTRYAALGMGCMAAFWTIDRTLLLL